MDELGELPTDAAMKKKETVLHDSMVTVRLSEPEPELGGSVISGAAASTELGEKVEVDEHSDKEDEDQDQDEDEAKTTANQQIAGGVIPEEDEESDDTDADTVYETEIARMVVPGGKEVRRGSDRSDSETESVNWEVLERTEEQEPRDQDTEDVSCPIPCE